MSRIMNTDTRPWYREPWPWILMFGPFVVIVAGVITTYLAVVSNDGLVEDDYYKQGLAVNQRTARNQHASELGMEAEILSGGADATLLRVFLKAQPGAPMPESLALRIVHPTRGGMDQSLRLQSDGAGFYSGKLSAPLSGRWHVALEDDKRDWRLVGDWEVEKQSSLRLSAEAQAAGGTGVRSDNNGR